MRTRNQLTLFFLVFLTANSTPAQTFDAKILSPLKVPETNCRYAKEYIAIIEFIHDSKMLGLSEKDTQILAYKMAQACSGAAERFIKIAGLLTRTGVTSQDAIKLASEFSSRTDIEVDTFTTVFKKAFLEEYLDLDLESSLRMAKQLSTEFNGNSLSARKDFEALLHFCLSEKDLNLPRPQCGAFAVRIAHRGEKFQDGISASFLKLFEFLHSDSGPRLTTGQALELSEKLVEGGQYSSENFTQAYHYGISSKGLRLSVPEAIQFAKNLTLPKDLKSE